MDDDEILRLTIFGTSSYFKSRPYFSAMLRTPHSARWERPYFLQDREQVDTEQLASGPLKADQNGE